MLFYLSLRQFCSWLTCQQEVLTQALNSHIEAPRPLARRTAILPQGCLCFLSRHLIPDWVRDSIHLLRDSSFFSQLKKCLHQRTFGLVLLLQTEPGAMARLVFWPELNVKPFTQYVTWPCHMWLGLVLIRQHRVLRVWCCWLAFHSSLHGIQSERSQHDCCLFIRRAENGRVRAARSEAQTLEHSGTLYCCRGSRSTPGSHWHRRIKAQRNRHRSAYLYCHVNFSKRKRFFLFWKKTTTLSVKLVYKNITLWIQYTNTALTLASSLTSTLYSGYTYRKKLTAQTLVFDYTVYNFCH